MWNKYMVTSNNSELLISKKVAVLRYSSLMNTLMYYSSISTNLSNFDIIHNREEQPVTIAVAY